MDNISIARVLEETAALLEIDAADPFRIRSYRRAAEAVEQQTLQLSTLAADPKQLLAIAGIGKGMAANIVAILETGSTPLRDELLKKYRPSMLELLRLPGMGPKTVALMVFARGLRHRRPRRGRQGRPSQQTSSHGREIHHQAPQRHRGLPQEHQPLPHRPGPRAR
ncbi:MAG TPA: hypothetical protein VK593_07860 [Edaphobacter sp.]|nr:hypothetical protein [Edaphobacter sp.]